MGKHVKPLSNAEQRKLLAQWRGELMANERLPQVVKKVMDAALDDEHRHQPVAWKLVFDRILPVNGFSQAQGAAPNAVQVVINTVDTDSISHERVIEHENDD